MLPDRPIASHRRHGRAWPGVLAALLLLAHAGQGAANPWPAIARPSMGPPAAIGAPSNGCLTGASTLASEGPGFVSIRRERNRYYGHPELLRFIEDLGRQLARRTDQVMMVGDLAQPRGGRMAGMHASHQSGLDVDIWLQLVSMDALAYRKTAIDRDPPSMVAPGGEELATGWGSDQRFLLKAAAEDPRVDRIFVNPAIKRALCETEHADRRWLRKLRPWYGHDAHFHARLRCPEGDRHCVAQAPIPAGDGCGGELAWWFGPEARAPARGAAAAPEPMPAACRALLEAD